MDILADHFVADAPNGHDVFGIFGIIAYFGAKIADVHIDGAVFWVVTNAINRVENDLTRKYFALMGE